MINKLKKTISVLIVALMIMSVSINAFAATVGQQLMTAEDGWTRYDNTAGEFSYIGNWTQVNEQNYYMNTRTQTMEIGSKVCFNFTGSKLRILTAQDHVNHNAGKHTVYIDGVNCGTYEYFPNSASLIPCMLVYEKLDLTYKEHYVEVVTEDYKNTSWGATWDCIDIDVTGTLKPYNELITLNATAGDSKVTLKWDIVNGATGYNVKRATTAGGPYTTIASSVTSATYTDTSVENGTTYYYVVTALNASGESANSNEASVTLANLQKLKLVLEVNEEKQLSVTDDLTDNTNMVWTSSDTSIATVDGNGKLKAIKPGDTVVTSTSRDGSYIESINVLVVDLAKQLAVDLKIGDACRLTVDDLANTANVTWTAYDTTIATVSSKGKVTAVSEGLTYVTATDNNGNEVGRIYIRVRE